MTRNNVPFPPPNNNNSRRLHRSSEKSLESPPPHIPRRRRGAREREGGIGKGVERTARARSPDSSRGRPTKTNLTASRDQVLAAKKSLLPTPTSIIPGVATEGGASRCLGGREREVEHDRDGGHRPRPPHPRGRLQLQCRRLSRS